MKLIKRTPQAITSLAYIALFLLLWLAFWNPMLPLGAGPVDLLLVLDESNSIKSEKNDKLWQSFLQQSSSLPEGSRISLIRFADRAKVEVPWITIPSARFSKLQLEQQLPRQRFLDQGATDLDSALSMAIQHSSAKHHTAILISSDGIDTITPSQNSYPLANKNPYLSLFFLDAKKNQQHTGLHIQSVNLPENIKSGQSLPLSIAIKAFSNHQGSLEILLNKHLVHSFPLAIQSGELKVLNFQLRINKPGTQLIEVISRDPQKHIIEQQKHSVSQLNNKQLLYIGNNSIHSGFEQLKQDGWNIISQQAAQLSSNDDTFFNHFDVIIMEDIAASRIKTHVLENLIKAVEKTATGLIVLGGSHSFGSGGYRHSKLENLLPVTAESSRPLPATAVLFLLDKSGSMEASSRSSSRLADALRAVSESAKSLRPGDESALLAFDRDVTILLPLKHRVNAAKALDQAWPLEPSGGTQLAPALLQAIEVLNNSTSKQRFIILVTDGFVAEKNIATLKTALKKSQIQLIALAIGDNADIATLQSLAAINNGRVLQVSKSAQLPRFMRQELEIKQQSWNKDLITPISVQQLPFSKEQNLQWLKLPGYQITRTKPSASTYIATNKGDPLLAIWPYGAGHVAALPGGILQYASGESLLKQLSTWLDSHQQNPNLKVTHRYQGGNLTLVVDAVDADQQWHPAAQAEVILTHPSGISYSQALVPLAPGRFTAVMKAPSIGLYSARIRVNQQHTGFDTYLSSHREYSQHNIVPWLQRALANQQFQHWHESSLNTLLLTSSGQFSTRTLWLVLALFIYLALIVFERSSGLHALLAIRKKQEKKP